MSPRFGIGINDARVPSGLMGKSAFARRFEASIRVPVVDWIFRVARKVLLNNRVLNLLARQRGHPVLRLLRHVVDVVLTRVDRLLLERPRLLRLALAGRRHARYYRSAFGALLFPLVRRYLEDWLHRQRHRVVVPAPTRDPTPPPPTYRGWKRLRDAIQPGWNFHASVAHGDPVKILPTDTLTPRERVERLLAGKPTDRVGFGPNWNFAPCYLGGSNIWEFCFDGIATGLANVNTFLRLGGTDFLPLGFGAGGYAVPFPDAHSRFYYDWTLPDDAGFPQFLETTLLESLDDLFDYGLNHQVREITKRLVQDALVLLREYFYLGRVHQRYFGPVLSQFFPYADGIVSAFDLLPLSRGMGGFALDCRKHRAQVREAFSLLAEPFTDLMVNVGRRMGARTILVGCSRGSNTFMSVDRFADTHWPAMKYAFEQIWKAGMVPTCHWDNDWTESVTQFVADRIPAHSVLFHLDQVDLVEVHAVTGDKFCLMGGLDPGVVVLSSPARLESVLQRYIESIGQDGLILASGCELPVDTPVENLAAYKRAIAKHGVFRA